MSKSTVKPDQLYMDSEEDIIDKKPVKKEKSKKDKKDKKPKSTKSTEIDVSDVAIELNEGLSTDETEKKKTKKKSSKKLPETIVDDKTNKSSKLIIAEPIEDKAIEDKAIKDKYKFVLNLSYFLQFKTVIDVLSNIIDETVITIQNSKEFKGLLIMSADSSRSIYMRVRITDDNFNNFYCEGEENKIGISLVKLNKLLKIIEKEDNVVLYSTDNKMLKMEILGHKKKITRQGLSLLELEHKSYKKTKSICVSNICMDTLDFHKMCKNMESIADYVEIKCTLDNISFKCSGDADSETIYKNGCDIDIKYKYEKSNISGNYDLKNITMFNKFSTLCDKINILIYEDKLLNIIYNVLGLGVIEISFSPIQPEHISNVNYSYSEDEDEAIDVDVIDDYIKYN